MMGEEVEDVEGLEDVAFSIAPLTNEDITFMLDSTWVGRKLKGFRNIPEADINSVRDVITRMGCMAVDFPQIKEIDINPILVLQKGGRGCLGCTH